MMRQGANNNFSRSDKAFASTSYLTTDDPLLRTHNGSLTSMIKIVLATLTDLNKKKKKKKGRKGCLFLTLLV